MKLETMSQKVLFIESQTEIKANCSEDVPVMCPAVDTNSIDFLSLAWYKLNKLNKTKVGIIRRGKDNKTRQYKSIRSPNPRFGEKHSLVIPGVTPEDSGTYECEISAKVGQQNQNHEVHLTVHECVTQTDTITTIMTTVLNATQPVLPCPKQEEDIPAMWSIVGYTAVGLTKIVLSLISIWVNILYLSSRICLDFLQVMKQSFIHKTPELSAL
ncbi:uncharacterized protein LOC116382056 isoform X2 [Anarrhichthys ocellatus]|uniref:uncharacterized protein LOC116382056 isoform X2 n=1 Tax=Anarrhichthys ocellatus TaxID=433405 RepID=UPI0012EDD59C|nr:uncharacterized protein LOC116382056 isoform X2 [Anarrhichthys ocellatus]